MLRLSVLFIAAAALTGINAAAGTSAFADALYAQYYPPYYGYPPSSRPPCYAVTPGPLQGIRVIDVSRIDDNIKKVMDSCAAAPNETVPQAFRQALGRRR